MKKLLLIAVLTLGVIACDKNELGMDMDGSSINAPIEAEIVSENTDRYIGFLNSLSENSDVMISNKGDKHAASTAKPAEGENWIETIFFDAKDVLNNDIQGAYVVDDTQGDACADPRLSNTETVYYILRAHATLPTVFDLLVIEVNGTIDSSTNVSKGIYDDIFSTVSTGSLIRVDANRTTIEAGFGPNASKTLVD